jgi:hypothetical protein
MILRLCCLFSQSETYMTLDWDRKVRRVVSFDEEQNDHLSYRHRMGRPLNRTICTIKMTMIRSCEK